MKEQDEFNEKVVDKLEAIVRHINRLVEVVNDLQDRVDRMEKKGRGEK